MQFQPILADLKKNGREYRGSTTSAKFPWHGVGYEHQIELPRRTSDFTLLLNNVCIKPISTHSEERTTYFDVFVKHGEVVRRREESMFRMSIGNKNRS